MQHYRTDESFKMEEKHGDQQNLASSRGCKYFIREIPQGSFLYLYFVLCLLFGCVSLAEIKRLTFSKLKFEFYSFSCVPITCETWVSLKSRCWVDLSSFFVKIVLVTNRDIIRLTVAVSLSSAR